MENLSDALPTLEELNSEEAKNHFGGSVFVSVLMVLGVVGILHVIIILGFRMKPSNHRIFILYLGLLDMTICCVVMPGVLVKLQKPYMIFMGSACKFLRFVSHLMCTASAKTLVLIAIDRYRKICVPHGKQMSIAVCKALCGIVMIVSSLVAWPAAVLYGHSTVETRVKNITGVQCHTEDKFKNTKYQVYFNAVIMLIVLSVCFILTVLYIMIGIHIFQQKTFKTVKSVCRSEGSDGVEMTSSSGKIEATVTSNDDLDVSPREVKRKLNFTKSGFSSDFRRTKHTVNLSQSGKMDKSKRKTFILFLITIVFFCSFVTHFIFKTVTFVNPSFVSNMTYPGKVAYNTFLWCVFINNIANPMIYGFYDRRFREEIRHGYSSILSFLTRCF